MATEQLEESALSRLKSISEELQGINAEIVGNLEVLQVRDGLVKALITRCDGIALELDAIQMELGHPLPWTPAAETESPDTSSDGSGLVP